MIKIGYKIVKKDLTSTNIGFEIIQYKVGEWVHPRKNYGPLSIFTKENYAKAHTHSVLYKRFNYRLFRCEYEQSKIYYLFTPYETTLKERLPIGTGFADAVRLLEEIN